MPLDNTERLYLERQVTLARAILVALSLVALLETSGEPVRRSSVVFLSVYLLAALGAALVERFSSEARFRISAASGFPGAGAFFSTSRLRFRLSGFYFCLPCSRWPRGETRGRCWRL